MTDPDEAKRQAARERQRAARRARGVQPLRLADCGTTSAYRRHLRLSEPVDAACREAWNDNARRYRAAKKAQNADGDQTGP